MIKQIDQQGFKKALQAKDTPVVVNFATDWWPHCKRFMPVLEEVATEYANELEMYTININNYPDTVEKYDVMTVPAVIVFQNSKIANSAVNSITKEAVFKLVFKGEVQ